VVEGKNEWRKEKGSDRKGMQVLIVAVILNPTVQIAE
jgi:hypothetical protein